ncbi:MarR family transcriptional regulator [Serinibacter arcticus]|uniref:MarR family transcriptional regulator n=1 Tax=Serinibacter arcticus TaxID=1655435 RepID=A0A2U1ZWM1_9MICO|nr:MarR family winged helix-turn-helix transcriptional regulator [Serinibacter arcticus]PWD51378.1 MarR family transcriptional regulator [Serinibacter arcticus]
MTAPAPTLAEDPTLDDVPTAAVHDPAAVALVEEQISVLFQRAKLLWRRAAESVHPELQPVGYRMLSQLVHRGPTNAGTLADCLDTDKSVISRQARVLGDLELITVEPDPSDGRGRLFQATEPARELVLRTRAEMSQMLFGGLGALDAEEVEQLGAMLGRLNEAARPAVG